jgi:UDP-N-acetylglucosamine pyrophosphorylase
MAAGKGTRMKDPERAKVMYELNGKPMIHYVVDLAYGLRASRVIVVVGHQGDVVAGYVRTSHPDAVCVLQRQQLGTGHAVMQAEGPLRDFDGDVLVLSGDVPLLTLASMQEFIRHHRDAGAAATILTATLPDPAGYGRIVRNPDGSVQKIVEHRDASEAELAIQEINSGIYVFDRAKLFDGLQHISAHNVQNEYYLTDVFEYFWRHAWRVCAVRASHPDEIRGVNTPEQLEEARRVALVRA